MYMCYSQELTEDSAFVQESVLVINPLTLTYT